MRTPQKIIYLSVITMVFQSCSMNLETRVEVLKFLAKEITVPDKCLCVDQGNLHLASGLSAQEFARLFVVYTSQDCSDCVVSHISDTSPLFSFANNDKRFNTVVYISPREDEFDAIVEKLEKMNYKHPVYLDKEGIIEAQLPSNQLFHIFLLDRYNKVRFIGNPMSNVKSITKFTRKLNRL